MTSELRYVGLTSEQARYVLGTLPLSDRVTQALTPVLSGRTVLALTEKEQTELLDAVGDRLVRIGFDPNWEPTAEGMFLESLIDALINYTSSSSQ